MDRKVTSICYFSIVTRGAFMSDITFKHSFFSYPQSLKYLVSEGRVDFGVKTLFTQEGRIPELFKKFIL